MNIGELKHNIRVGNLHPTMPSVSVEILLEDLHV